jgi:hypothetical protein
LGQKRIFHWFSGVNFNPDLSENLYKVLKNSEGFLVRNREYHTKVAKRRFDKKKLAGVFLEAVKSK